MGPRPSRDLPRQPRRYSSHAESARRGQPFRVGASRRKDARAECTARDASALCVARCATNPDSHQGHRGHRGHKEVTEEIRKLFGPVYFRLAPFLNSLLQITLSSLASVICGIWEICGYLLSSVFGFKGWTPM